MRICNCPTCSRFLCASDGNVRVKCRYCKAWWLFEIKSEEVINLSVEDMVAGKAVQKI